MILAVGIVVAFFGREMFLLWTKNQVYLSGKNFNWGYVLLPKGEPLFFWLYSFLHLIIAATAIFFLWVFISQTNLKSLLLAFALGGLWLCVRVFESIGAATAFFFFCLGIWLLYEAKRSFNNGLIWVSSVVIDRGRNSFSFWIAWVIEVVCSIFLVLIGGKNFVMLLLGNPV
jgi:hypothetical protein